MKKVISISLVFFVLMVVGEVTAQSLKVCSYNIRNDNNYDVERGNGWDKRLPQVSNLIKYSNPDIIGTQEGLKHQLDQITELVPEYEYIGVGREDGKEEGEYAAILYKKSRFQLLLKGDFWIAKDCTKPNFGWDAACKRVCSWGKFTDKQTRKSFFVFNVHMDHVGLEARREGAKLILEKIKSIAGVHPVILTGDFNVDQRNESYLLLNNSEIVKDAYELSSIKYITNGTFNAFDIARKTDERIDHIFLTNQFKVLRYGMLTELYWDEKHIARFPSDHFPIIVDLVQQ